MWKFNPCGIFPPLKLKHMLDPNLALPRFNDNETKKKKPSLSDGWYAMLLKINKSSLSER
ncbi:hypothetical protein GCM10023310_07780 [Paenibacillus vulneris]